MSYQPSLFGTTDPAPKSPVKMNIRKNTDDHGLLALDLATVTGWCNGAESGSWDFTTPIKKSKQALCKIGKHVTGKKQVKFEKCISEYLEDNKTRIIAVEKPFIYHSKKRKPNFISFEMYGILKIICETYNILLVEYHVQHIKQFATGKGNADKEMMINACKRYNVTPGDHNEADALHLYHFAIQDLKLKI